MQLWVGLGNPEPAMARQRHNVGFMAIEVIAVALRWPAWRSRFKGRITEGGVGQDRILALKPMTYMNESGAAVQAASAFHKIPPQEIVVFHDELDLAPGKLRIRQGGGTAGHNGLRSIARHLGTPEFRRVRIGIGHPGHKEAVLGHVLGDFSRTDRDWLVPLLDALAETAPLIAAGESEAAMTRIALLTRERA